jgi:hypothetical protein
MQNKNKPMQNKNKPIQNKNKPIQNKINYNYILIILLIIWFLIWFYTHGIDIIMDYYWAVNPMRKIKNLLRKFFFEFKQIYDAFWSIMDYLERRYITTPKEFITGLWWAHFIGWTYGSGYITDSEIRDKMTQEDKLFFLYTFLYALSYTGLYLPYWPEISPTQKELATLWYFGLYLYSLHYEYERYLYDPSFEFNANKYSRLVLATIFFSLYYAFG